MNAAALFAGLFISGGSLLFWGPTDSSHLDFDFHHADAHLGDSWTDKKKCSVSKLFEKKGKINPADWAKFADTDKDGKVSKKEMDLLRKKSKQWAKSCGGPDMMTVAGVAALAFALCAAVCLSMRGSASTKGDLKLRVIGGSNLRNVETGLVNKLFSNKSDTYLRATVGHQDYKTPTCSDSLNPDWQAQLRLEGSEVWSFTAVDLNDASRRTVKIEVFDQAGNDTNDKDQSLGCNDIDINAVASSPGRNVRKSVDLLENGLKNGATVEVELCFEPY